MRLGNLGKSFEVDVLKSAVEHRLVYIRIPTGCRIIGRNAKGKPITAMVKTPFDDVLAGDQACAFVDAKDIGDNAFQYSQITQHQVTELLKLERKGHRAGYVVNFKNLNTVRFFSASQLASLRPRESLKPDDGLDLGTSYRIAFNKLNLNKETK